MTNNIQRKLWDVPNEEKEPVTHYIDKNTVDLIADYIHETRKSLPLSKRKKLNRSLIINFILTEVFQDNVKYGNESFLAKLVEEWKNS